MKSFLVKNKSDYGSKCCLFWSCWRLINKTDFFFFHCLHVSLSLNCCRILNDFCCSAVAGPAVRWALTELKYLLLSLISNVCNDIGYWLFEVVKKNQQQQLQWLCVQTIKLCSTVVVESVQLVSLIMWPSVIQHQPAAVAHMNYITEQLFPFCILVSSSRPVFFFFFFNI